MQLLHPQNFHDYELLDCGDFLKMERFGKYITIRPEPQAVWSPLLSLSDWRKRAHVEFIPKSSSSGNWKKYKEMPDQWKISYSLKHEQTTATLQFRLGLTSFKHVGLFPEQAVNWDFIFQNVLKLRAKNINPKVLNLFAYTGAASLAARAAGAEVFHLDSVKQVVSWSKENMELSGLSDIRWIVEDAMTYVKREIKRGKKYHGIILDPPAFGHGTNGERWKLEEMINEMINNIAQLMEKDFFLLLNTYSLGFSSLILENFMHQNFADYSANTSTGELYLTTAQSKLLLPLGVFARIAAK
jgi:23S rRNA (cytosine1962-C5)-methyltransferase